MRAFCFGLEHREGKDMFLPIVLPKAGFTLRFRVKGQHIRLALTNQREETRNKDASGAFHCYFMAIGAFHNCKTYFKRSNKSGDPVLADASRDTNLGCMAWPDRYREYWVTYDSGSGWLRLGCGGKDEVGQEAYCLVEWQDPSPHKDIEYVSVSCWDTPVDFAMFKNLALVKGSKA